MSPGLDSWECAYGENGWQVPARFAPERTDDPLAIGRFALLEGSPLSPPRGSSAPPARGR